MVGALSPDDAVASGPFATTIRANLQRLTGGDQRDLSLPDVLVAAHTAVYAGQRGWRILATTPTWYGGIDVRVEVLP
ncbi:hypothetical protein [Microtetraspora sp. NBRC 16547]|uniref:hypothetical protein n=1 Tax=Microtetraspora sp. NBRC 16547 TaxID=3030993 RepID=UPI0024A194E3|nr:hypothetical protein [Microtetraspora sp. NBRC 16547]GLX02384.1 hypothetical protein Misp02_64700 [Microtetraspora sp. NBRC 16547]